MNIPRITPAFLFDVERLATKTIEENAYQGSRDLKPGQMVLLVQPENQLAMVNRIRALEELLASAIGELRDTGGAFASEVADRLEVEAAR